MKKVLILGGGYGGLKVARKLIEDIPGEVEITLVDRMPYHSFKTEYYALSAGTISDKKVRMSFPMHEKLKIVYGEIIDIDLEKKKVFLNNREDGLIYDYLVIALGCEDNYHQVEGAKENTLSIQSIQNARRTYEKINNLEAHKRVIIVGGGLSGVEMAAELRESRPDLHITILDRGNSILRPFDNKIQKFATEWFKQNNIQIVNNSHVDYVRSGVVCNNGECLYCDAIIWTAGVQPNHLIRNLPVEKDKNGRVIIDEFHRVNAKKDIFVVGDCASLPYPSSAQLAEQQGKQVADILIDILQGKEIKKPGTIKLKGTLGALGKKNGFATFNEVSIVGIFPRILKSGVLWLHKKQ